jgi:WD40 repeat protein
VGKKHGDVRDTFARPGKQQPAHPARASMTNVNIVITCVAWSMPQVKSEGEEVALKEEDQNTVVAAAGSNGVVVIWNARQAFFSQTSGGGSSTMAHQQPEATLSQHTRAVNSLAWHPKRPGLLLTASQVSSLIVEGICRDARVVR